MSTPVVENEKQEGRMITYLAVPYPLPKAWRDELINHARYHAGDGPHLKSIDMRMRASIGVLVTRPMVAAKQTG